MLYKNFCRCITSWVILFFTIFFVGCSSDFGGGGSASSDSIVGVWSCTESGDDGSISYRKLTFELNGQFNFYFSDDSEQYETTASGKYTAENNILTMYWYWDGVSNDYEVEIYEYEISGNALTLYYEGEEDGTFYRE